MLLPVRIVKFIKEIKLNNKLDAKTTRKVELILTKFEQLIILREQSVFPLKCQYELCLGLDIPNKLHIPTRTLSSQDDNELIFLNTLSKCIKKSYECSDI